MQQRMSLGLPHECSQGDRSISTRISGKHVHMHNMYMYTDMHMQMYMYTCVVFCILYTCMVF